MGQRDSTGTNGDETTDGPAAELAERGSDYVPAPPGTVRRVVDSGAITGIAAGAAIFSGIRAWRRGDGRSGFRRLLFGGMLATVAAAQQRSSRRRGEAGTGVEETDVVDTSPDVEGVATEGTTGETPRATGEEASEVVDTAPDLEGAGTEGATADEAPDPATGEEASEVVDTSPDVEGLGMDTESDDAAESGAPDFGVPDFGDYERLGEAAFDEQSGRVPAPQEAFNRELLSPGAEAFWGVHESDETLVVVSVEFDPIEDAGEFSYVASSEIDDDGREVRVPDTVLDHWDDAAGGGTAVESGTGLVFLLVDELQDEGLLVVVPEQWSDDLLEESEE